MWDELKRRAGGFTSAVLSARDADGYPASVRAALAFDDGARAVRVGATGGVELQAGAASLLFHSHDEQLWGLRIITARGELARSGDEWLFRPTKLQGEESAGALGMVRMLLNCRKTAKAYLARRGLARPAIPWSHLRELKGKA